MSSRRTNLALAVLVLAAIVTGGVAFGVGTPLGKLVTVLHAVLALAILILAPWKSAIARRGLAKARRGRLVSIALTLAALVAIGSGVLFSTGLVMSYGPIDAMQLHVGSAVAAGVLVLIHFRMRPVKRWRLDLERRNLLRAGALTGLAGALWISVEGTARALSWPGANRRFTGSHERGSFEPVRMPVTQWLNDAVPRLDAQAWTLTVLDASGPARAIRYDELELFTDEVEATLDCTGGWFATQRWVGARLDRLVNTSGGTSIRVRSHTGYERRFPADQAPRLWLAHSLGGSALSAGHGYPARLVAPGRRGFWWVKWVTEISVDDRPPWLQSPFPLS